MKAKLKELYEICRGGAMPKGAAAVACVEDMRLLARKRLPKMIFDFIDGGSYDEVTLRANRRDFARIGFRPQMLNDVSGRQYRTRVVGQELAFPVMVSPAGFLRLADPEGERAIARAVGKTGVVFVVSTAASCSIEDIAQAATGPLWFQLYIWRDREVVASLVKRAKDNGYQALVVTVDLQVVGKRDKDIRNGLSIPPKLSVRSALDVLGRPRWLRDFFTNPPVTFANFEGLADGDDRMSHSSFINEHLINPTACWDDLAWLKDMWGGPLLLKGIITPEDAQQAAACGVDGIVVSNHGGRQLDGVPSAIRALPQIAEAVDGQLDLILDSGVRRGADVVKAFALGARATMTGRSWFWGLAAEGQLGVERIQEILAREIDETLALLGRRSLAEIDRSCVILPGE